ncbi:TonB-dependent receptor [Sphingobium lactosutens]|uniref:TonB-dependent receptor n=1 Tax=Sphingobium lactosutens TaxID=522773 RepID=UPI0015BAE35A|nr:TonB-dependent receptor [Sphingobium lactosutens]NWK96254.1 TonB-dependent receptor [Sphingobium lactosutens]
MTIQKMIPTIFIALGSASIPALAQAQAIDKVDPGEIIVTAQRRSQSIQSVPLAITALSGEQLVSKGVTNSADLGRIVPNLQVSSPFGDTQPNFSMRGVSVANEYNSNQVSPVGVYVDDVGLVSRASQGIGLYDLERVEVLRGPQGTLFGRNTTGGAIHFLTATPSLSGTRGYAEAGYGNYDTYKAQGAIETTMVEDQLGFRAAINYEKGDARFHNVFPGARDAGSINNLQYRATLRIRPGAGPLDIVIKAYGGRSKGTQQAVYGPAAFRAGLGFFEINENRIGDNRVTAYGASAKVAYELSPQVTLTSITAYGKSSLTTMASADGAPIDILYLPRSASFHQFSEEARFNYDSTRVKAVAGLFYGWDSTSTGSFYHIASALGPGVDGGFFQRFDQVRRTYAGFAQADVNLTEKLVATVGLRYTFDRAAYRDGYAFLFLGGFDGPQVPLATTVPCTTAPGTCPYDPNARYNINGRNKALTGRTALTYTFDSGALVYASYNRGYRSGAFNGGGYTSSSGITYIDPEYVNAYEVGAKGRFLDRRLTLALAGFFYSYRNQQLQDTRPGPVSFLLNAPRSQNYGAEAEATFRASPKFSINGSLGYLHATYKELRLAGNDLSGNDLPFAPRWTAHAGFDWSPFDLAGGPMTLSPSVDYTSRQWFSPYNGVNGVGSAQVNSELQQPGFAKVNVNLSWTRGNVTVKGWAQNLLQRKTLLYGLDLRQAGFPYNYIAPGAPRTYGGTVRVAF